METKLCSKCKKILPVAKFYKSRDKKTGYHSQCKDCEYFSKRRRKPYRDQREYNRKWRKRNPNYSKNYKASLKDKRSLYCISKVGYNLAAGKLKREPCACGETKVQAHHEDYDTPLDVIWMCQKCHKALHAQKKEDERRKMAAAF